MSVHLLSAWSNWGSTGWIVMKKILFRKSVEEFQVSFESDKNNGYFT